MPATPFAKRIPPVSRLRRCASALLLALSLSMAPSVQAATPDAGAPLHVADYPAPIRVACVGDSITAGYGTSSGVYRYPNVLAGMLGHDFVVGNFGVRGATLLKRGDRPYWNENAFRQAQGFRPDAVVILLGTNDTRAVNWRYKAGFAADLMALIDTFRNLPNHPRVWLGLPPITGDNVFGAQDSVLENQVLPLLRHTAAVMHTGLIDIHGAFAGHADLLPDYVHPNDAGYALLSTTVFQALTGAPIITPGDELFVGSTVVTLHPAPMPETIHYTLDGSPSSERSPLYTRPLLLRATGTVTACAIFPDGTQSPVVTAHLTRVELPYRR